MFDGILSGLRLVEEIIIMAMSQQIFFDLEGPLTPQDNAYELMKLIPHGGEIFEVISRYDDLLTLEGREGYEPGDTLALIAPFLIYHRLAEEEIEKLAESAGLVGGVGELISWLNSSGWEVFCISTSYEQYARRICQKVGIKIKNLTCTRFPLDFYQERLGKKTLPKLEEVEKEILKIRPFQDDEQIKKRLDRFFWKELPEAELGKLIKEVKPVGGKRKVEALMSFAGERKLSETAVVGDSITDFKMLQAVNEAGGLAIAFNANEYVLPYATIGLASTEISELKFVLEIWEKEGREGVEQAVKEKEKAGGRGERGYFHWLYGRKELSEVLEIHKQIRRRVREEAGKLG